MVFGFCRPEASQLIAQAHDLSKVQLGSG